jgi:hypothetical protein
MNTKLLTIIASLSLLIASTGCQSTTAPPIPTTQQITSTVNTAQRIENAVVAGLELSGVIKSKNQAKANALQAAINGATAQYQSDLAAGNDELSALADAALVGIDAYQTAATSTTSPSGN